MRFCIDYAGTLFSVSALGPMFAPISFMQAGSGAGDDDRQKNRYRNISPGEAGVRRKNLSRNEVTGGWYQGKAG
jgi:hypothetical protein